MQSVVGTCFPASVEFFSAQIIELKAAYAAFGIIFWLYEKLTLVNYCKYLVKLSHITVERLMRS